MWLFKKNKSEEVTNQSDTQNISLEKTEITKKTRKSKKSKNPSSEISDIAKKYNIRVSAPHGYYPEDVDRVLTDLDKQLTLLSKENSTADIKIAELIKERDSLKTIVTKLKLQISTMEIPDASTETDFHMLSRLSTINPNVGELDTEKLEDNPENKTTNLIEPVVEDHKYDTKDETKSDDAPAVFDDLISKTNRQRMIVPPALKQIPQDEVISTNKIDEEILTSLTEETLDPEEITGRRTNRKSKFDLEILGGNEDA